MSGTATARSAAHDTGLWRHPALRAVLAAECVSMLGSSLTVVAVPWLMLTRTGSAGAMGLVMAAQMAGTTLFGTLGASWAGRAGPRRVMLVGDACRGVLIALVPLLASAGSLAVPLTAAAMFVFGAVMAPYSAAQQATLSDVVGEDGTLLSRATAALQGAMRLSMMLGPPLAGVLVALFGTVPVILADAASFALSLLVLSRRLPKTLAPPPPPSRLGGAGLRALLADPLTATWSLALVCSEFAWQGLFAALPVVALEFGDRGPTIAGALSGAFGAAALTGTLLVGPLLRHLSAPVLAVGGRVPLALCFLVLPLPLGITAVFGCLVLAGLFNGVSSAPVAAVRALRLPAAVRAEALTVATAVSLAGGTCGLLVSGTTIRAEGTRTLFVILALAQLTAAALHLVGFTADRRSPAPGTGPDAGAGRGAVELASASHPGRASGAGLASRPGSGSGSGSVSHAGLAAEVGSASNPGRASNPGSGSGSGSVSHAGLAADVGSASNSGPAFNPGSGSHAGPAADARSASGAGAGSHAGPASEAGSGSHAGSASNPGSAFNPGPGSVSGSAFPPGPASASGSASCPVSGGGGGGSVPERSLPGRGTGWSAFASRDAVPPGQARDA